MSHENDNPNEPGMNDLSEIYQSTRSDEPGAALDAAILAQAEEAVAPKRKRPAWIAPVGLAATVLLGVNLAVNLKDYSSDPDVFMETSRPIAQSADKPERMASARSDEAADTDSTSQKIELSIDYYDLLESTETGRENYADLPTMQPAPAPQSSYGYAADALNEAGARSPEAPASSPADLSNVARRAVAENEIERTIESSRQRTAKQTEVRNIQSKELNAELPERKKKQRAPEPEAIVREANPPSRLESVARSPESTAGSTVSSATSAVPAPRPVDATPAPFVNPAPESTPTAENRLMAAPPVPGQWQGQRQKQEQEQEQDSDDTGLQEVVVTGSSISEIDDSPHRRLTAKDQVKRNARQLTNSAMSISGDDVDRDEGTAASAKSIQSAQQSAPVYICDLSALQIDTNAIETAKVKARTLEPPLNALTWPTHIRELSSEGDYVAACTHLAAYQQLFPDVAMIELLPVTIPTKN